VHVCVCVCVCGLYSTVTTSHSHTMCSGIIYFWSDKDSRILYTEILKTIHFLHNHKIQIRRIKCRISRNCFLMEYKISGKKKAVAPWKTDMPNLTTHNLRNHSRLQQQQQQQQQHTHLTDLIFKKSFLIVHASFFSKFYLHYIAEINKL
jgi:hypothetical protein